MKQKRPKNTKRSQSKPSGPTDLGAPSIRRPFVEWVGEHEPHVVQIEKPLYGGAFLAHVEGKAVFVPLALPGEQARIRITGNKSGYSTAEATGILTPSSERVAPPCPHFGACGGCNYQHANYETQLALKQAVLRETLARAGVDAPENISVLASNPWAYRNRIRIAFDAEANPGYRGRRSHAVVPIGQCPIAAPLLLAAAQAAAETLHRIPPDLRPAELLLFCDPTESSLLATFFTANADVRFAPLAQALHERVPALKGAQLAAEGRPGHPARTLAQWAAASITYRAANFDFRVDQGAFFQVNRWLIDPLVEHVTANYQGNLAWDLFAGVGLFARSLTARFGRVAAVESAPPACAALEQNLQGTNAAAVNSSTLDFLRRNHGDDRPDLIILDPPRTGLDPETCTHLARIAAPAMVYVSCDPATLARDLRTLTASGYAIESINLADLFPQTFHLETVVHLRRS